MKRSHTKTRILPVSYLQNIFNKKADKLKYLNYMAGIASRYQKEKKDCPVLRMIVIYTGDIMRGQVSCEYNIGAARLKVEPAFLSELIQKGYFCG